MTMASKVTEKSGEVEEPRVDDGGKGLTSAGDANACELSSNRDDATQKIDVTSAANNKDEKAAEVALKNNAKVVAAEKGKLVKISDTVDTGSPLAGDIPPQSMNTMILMEHIDEWNAQISALPDDGGAQGRQNEAVPGAMRVDGGIQRNNDQAATTSAANLSEEGSVVQEEPVTLSATLAPEPPQDHQLQQSGTASFGRQQPTPTPLLVEAKLDTTEQQKEHHTRRNAAALAGVLILLVVIILLAVGLAGVLSSSPHHDTQDMTSTANESSSDLIQLPTPAVSLLEQVRANGTLTCVYLFIPGVLMMDPNTGMVDGFNAAFCGAVAAAIFGPDNYTSRIQWVDQIPISDPSHYVRPLHVLSSASTMDRQVRESHHLVPRSFSNAYCYDGARVTGLPFFVESCAEKGFKHVDECEDFRLCLFFNSHHRSIIADVLPERRMVLCESALALLQNFANGTCNAFVYESIGPAALRIMGYRGEYEIGTTYLSKEPWSMVSPAGDPQWADFINAVLHSLLVAEQYNITQSTFHRMPQTTVFGEEYQDMFQNAVAAVGNYGEIYERYLGSSVPRQSINQINDGTTGLMYSRPFGKIAPEIEVEFESLGPIMQSVLLRGRVRCGVRLDRPGFAIAQGDTTTGMDIDLCRAVAASLFDGDGDAVVFVKLTDAKEGFKKLATGAVDLFAGATWNLMNDVREPTTGLGFSFSQPYFYTDEDFRMHFNTTDDNYCLATRQEDHDWATYVFWVVSALIYAEEEGILQFTANRMPLIYVYGSERQRMLRDAVLEAGNYEEMYERNLEEFVPRSGRNLLNVGPFYGPQHYPMPGIMA